MYCRECHKPLNVHDELYGACFECRKIITANEARLITPSHKSAEEAVELFHHARSAKIILTTESSSSLPITERLDIVSAECVLGMNLFKDLGAGLRDIFGGRSASYQDALREARVTVLDEVRRQAADLGADAVVAISLDYSEISGGGKSMLFLVATGTAVKLADVPLSV